MSEIVPWHPQQAIAAAKVKLISPAELCEAVAEGAGVLESVHRRDLRWVRGLGPHVRLAFCLLA